MNTLPTAKTILCFGDSNTWGQKPDKTGRFPANVRWTGILQDILGDGYYIIEEGLGSRTTDLEYSKKPGRNGKAYLDPCLDSHRPLDLVILMLGTNDLKIEFDRSPKQIAEATRGLIKLIQEKIKKVGEAVPILLVSPIRIVDDAPRFAEFYTGTYDHNSALKSQQLAAEMKRVAEETGCEFFNAAVVSEPGEDGIHFSESSHPALGKAIAKLVEKFGVVIEKAQPQDAESIAEVQAVTWLHTYPNAELGITEADIRKRLEGENGEHTIRRIENWRKKAEEADGRSALYVARLKGKVIGFTLPAINPEGQHRIGALYVLPEAQGNGVGSRLIKENLAWHGNDQPIYLTVAAYNQNAIDFYKKFGFQETGKQVEDLPARKSGNKELPEIEMMRPALEKS